MRFSSKLRDKAAPAKRGSDLFENEGCLRIFARRISCWLQHEFRRFPKPIQFTQSWPPHWLRVVTSTERLPLVKRGFGSTKNPRNFVSIPCSGTSEVSRQDTRPSRLRSTANRSKPIRPWLLESRYGLGLALAETSDLPGAIKEFQEALRQDNRREFRLLRAVMIARTA